MQICDARLHACTNSIIWYVKQVLLVRQSTRSRPSYHIQSYHTVATLHVPMQYYSISYHAYYQDMQIQLDLASILQVQLYPTELYYYYLKVPKVAATTIRYSSLASYSNTTTSQQQIYSQYPTTAVLIQLQLYYLQNTTRSRYLQYWQDAITVDAMRACARPGARAQRAAGRRQAPSSRAQIFGKFSDFLIDFLRDNPIHVPTHTHVPYNTPGPPQGGVIQYPYPRVPIPQHLHISAKIPNTRAYPG